MNIEDIESLLNLYVRNGINSLFTAIPCRVVKSDLDEQRLDVEILVDRVNADGSTQKHSIILDVPLVFPASQSSMFSFPVNPNDTVLCIFSQRGIDRFKGGSNSSAPPLSNRKYSKNDAMAIPGLFGFSSAVNNPSKRNLSHSTDDATLTHNIGSGNECEVRLKSSGDIQVNTASSSNNIDFSIGGSKVLSLSSSEADFNVPVTAPEFTTDSGVVLGTHTHAQGNDSDNNTQAETDPPTT